MAKVAKGKAYKALKQSLLDNLAARGLIEDVYSDMVDEYMDLWLRRQELKRDIEKNGVTVFDEKRGMNVENRSVSLEVQVSRQMLNIYAALGFKDISGNVKALPDSDDDEL